MKTTKTLAFVSAALVLAFAVPAFAQDADGDGSTLSRAEVQADRNLWLRSGLAEYSGNQSADASVPGYAASVRAYRQSRNSPAYYAELARIQAARGATMASGPEAAAKVD